ncbi:MAG: NGG1p interacting factor NIF3 [Elusimicrobiota bacterium]
MKLKDFYKTVIETGIENDPRGKKSVLEILELEKKKYQELKDDEKKYYDKEKLINPYSDTRILNGTGEEEINTLMAGIDIETPEILLFDTLRRNGEKIDLALTHHPEGGAFANFYEVMGMQADILGKFGVPINIAEAIMEPRIKEVSRKVLPQNHLRAVDASRLLGVTFMSAHTVADNCVSSYLQSRFDNDKPEKISDVLEILDGIPEYQRASASSRGPVIFVGSKERRAGKIFVDMTGGTEGSVEAFEKLSQSGVGTIVGMHMSEEHYKNAEKYHINVVIAGHISSDSLGLNLLLDSVEKKLGKLNCIECSGFTRIKR